MLSHMLDCQLYGLRPGGHHLTSLLFHIANTVLLFLLLWKMTGAVWRSGVVAALFALHPLHVESVAWVAERKDVLSTFFFLLTLGAYVAYAEGKSKVQSPKSKVGTGSVPTRSCQRCVLQPRSFYYPLARLLRPGADEQADAGDGAVCAVAAGLLAAAASAVSCASARSSRFKSSRLKVSAWAAGSSAVPAMPLARLLLEKVPFLLLSAASCVVTFRVQQSGGAVLDVNNLPVGARVANALMSYVRYLGKMVWPEHLAALYLRKVPWPSWEVGLAALALVAASVVVIRLARRRPYLAVGWFWYLGTLVPVIGLVQVGMQTMADRYTYIPLIGIFIALAWGGWRTGAAAWQGCARPAGGWGSRPRWCWRPAWS